MKKTTKQILKERLVSLLDSDKSFSKEQSEKLLSIFDTSKLSTKTNDEGLVFCNYYKKYLPKENFRKISRNGKLVWSSMSIEGTKEHAKILTRKKSMNKKLASLLLDDNIEDIEQAKDKILEEYKDVL